MCHSKLNDLEMRAAKNFSGLGAKQKSMVPCKRSKQKILLSRLFRLAQTYFRIFFCSHFLAIV